MDRAAAGPEGRACRIWLLELPEELLHRIFRMVEDSYMKSGQTSAKFLELMTVCKSFQRGVSSVITNLSRGIAPKFCRTEPFLEVTGELQRQLARWGCLRRVELDVRGSICALTHLVPALRQSCPGLTALCIVMTDRDSEQTQTSCNISQLTSLTSLKSLSLTGFNSFTATLPPLPSLQTLTADFGTLACPSPLPALEKLVVGREKRSSLEKLWCCLQAPHLHTSPRLRHLSLQFVSVHHLRLPRSLQVLDLVVVRHTLPLDLGTELPELAEVRLVHQVLEGALVAPQGLATLLSSGSLRQLKLDSLSDVTPPGQLALRPGLVPLSQHSLQLQPPRLQQAVATLTNLELGKMTGLQCLYISHLRLQHLKLESLRELSLIEGLELQTQLTSLALHVLPLIRQLPDLRSFKDLVALELMSLKLEHWSPDSCSCLPRLKLLILKALMHQSPPSTPAATSAATSATTSAAVSVSEGYSPQSDPPPVASMLDLKSLPSLTEAHLSSLPISRADVSHMPLLKNLDICGCFHLSCLLGLHSLPRLHTLCLSGTMPELQSLSVASCPRLTDFACFPHELRHLVMKDLPALSSMRIWLSTGLHTLRVTSCPSLSYMPIHSLHSIESLELTGLPQLLPESFNPALGENVNLEYVRHINPALCNNEKLKRVRLIDLAQYSHLALVNLPLLESVQVSGCPLTAITLQELPHLTAPNLQIVDFSLPPVTTSANPPSTTEPEAPPLHPPSLSSHETPKGLLSLTLNQLPGIFPLDHLVLQPGPPNLNLEKLQIPQSVTDLTFSEPKLASLDVRQLASLQTLTVRSCASLTRLAGITSLPDLTSLHLTDVPKLEELAILSCPKLKLLLARNSFSPRHVHLEDLPSLGPQSFSRDVDDWLRNLWGGQPDNPLASLQSLKLRRLPNLSKLLVKDLERLETMELVGCSSLLKLHLENLPSLTSLQLKEPTSESFNETSGSSTTRPPDFSGCIESQFIHMATLQSIQCPTTLQSLSISSCPALTSLPLDQHGSGFFAACGTGSLTGPLDEAEA